MHFPPHLSKELQANIAAKDSVTVQGMSEGGKRMRAEVITNARTNKTLKDVPRLSAAAKWRRPLLLPAQALALVAPKPAGRRSPSFMRKEK